ncbi:unnamed protein product [Rotaria sp. Silwood1]|nr:unnamed protein product [Rotaria sp. Silwood1]CAF4736145.1 unnamed protein product [Rotaria sp. Silwood1]
MKDLSESLVREHQKLARSGKEILITYQGIKLTNDQIEKFKENEGKLVTVNGFLTTNILRSAAVNQAMKPSKQTNLTAVLLAIQCDLRQLGNCAIVADITQFNETSYEEQKEVLFDANITFRLDSVKKEEEIWLIEMSASNEGQLIKEKYIKDSHRQIQDLSIKILFGRLMCDMGQWNQSQHFFQHLLYDSNSNSEDLAKLERSLGEVLQWKGEWTRARKYYEWAYDRMTNSKPTRIKDSADILFNIGEITYLEGNYEEAQDYCERALAIHKEGKYDEALKTYEQAMTILQKYYPFDHVDIADNLNGMEHVHYGQGQYKKTVMFLNHIGDVLIEQKKYDEALKFYQRALETQEKYYRNSHVEIAATLDNLGTTCRLQKRFIEAIEYHPKALEIQEKYYPSNCVIISNTMNRIGHVLYNERKYDEAIHYYRRALSMQEKSYPDGHIETSHTLNSIGSALYEQKKFDEALQFYQKSLTIQETYHELLHIDIARSLNSIGNVLYSQEKYDEAIHFYQRSLDIREKFNRFSDIGIATVLGNIGSALYEQRKYDEAIDFHLRALTFREKFDTTNHDDIVDSLRNIANTLSEQEKYNEAMEFQQRALTTNLDVQVDVAATNLTNVTAQV